jgi:murein DD-endopeptidase MepM/ murein hydrolase activator NlpD
MCRVPRLLSAVLLGLVIAAVPPSAAGATGGASADSAAGGPLDAGALPFGAPTRQRPVARTFRVVPGRIREGGSVRVKVRVDERGVKRVAARVVAVRSGTGRPVAKFSLGKIRTGRTLRLVWPRRHVPAAGTYVVRLHVRDPHGSTLARAAASTGKSRLVVRPRPRPEMPQPEPPAQPTPIVPVAGGVFPVAGAHTFGSDGARFGAARTGHTHEGQDVMASEGTPVVAPSAGIVRFVDNQPRGAGWYVVLAADDGRTFFFAHLVEGSVSVAEGARVAAGQPLGQVGSTGSASGPHLHFEIWEGGWRDLGGHPVDPLPQLLAWDR